MKGSGGDSVQLNGFQSNVAQTEPLSLIFIEAWHQIDTI